MVTSAMVNLRRTMVVPPPTHRPMTISQASRYRLGVVMAIRQVTPSYSRNVAAGVQNWTLGAFKPQLVARNRKVDAARQPMKP